MKTHQHKIAFRVLNFTETQKKQAPGHGICLHERRNFGTYFLYFVYFFVPFEAF